jgi:hypothetical protein
MPECEQPGAMARGIAADAPVQGGPAAQRVEPLAPTGTVAQYRRSFQPIVFPVGLIIALLPQTYLPKLLV